MSENSQRVGDESSPDISRLEELVVEAKKTFEQTTSNQTDSAGLDVKGTIPENPDASPFAFHQHNYTTEYIKLADQKAALLFAATTGLLCYLFKIDLHSMWLKQVKLWNTLDSLCFLSTLSLFLGLCAACLVLIPSLKKSHRGLVFFGAVAEFELSSTYASEVLSTPNKGLTRAILQHTYDLASICNKKYKMLAISIWGAALGTVLGVLVLLLK